MRPLACGLGLGLAVLAVAGCTVANPEFDPRLGADGGALTPLPAEPSEDAAAGEAREPPAARPELGPVAPKQSEVDVLLVVDNSQGMSTAQARLAAGLPAFIAALEQLPGGASLRVGAVTSDLGAGPYATGNCSTTGDQGRLRVPSSCSMISPGDSFLEHLGGATNYTGAAGQAAGCLAKQGEQGCGFEQPLEAMRVALSGANGFLRQGAALAVIILTSEDDCSAKSPVLFDWNAPNLGPYADYRCFQQGVRCNGQTPPFAAASLSSCAPGGDLLQPVASRYVELLETLKGGRAAALVLAGPTQEPFQVSATSDGWGNALFKLKASCQSGGLSATPAVRLRAFREGLGASGLAGDICGASYAGPLAALLARVTALL